MGDITENFDDAQVSPAAGPSDVDMDNEALLSPTQMPAPARPMVGIETGIPIEVFIVSAEQIQWKIHTAISSLGRSSEHVVVSLSMVPLVSCCCLSQHRMYVFGLKICVCLMFTKCGAGKDLETTCRTTSRTLRTCWSRFSWMAG